ncbi:RIP homotypic interaction motif-containing protein [Vibrio parahaemolyticus]|nr:RIP homotypic interaction motif-containing protein [Vibrio parahaemolyticus]
MQQGEVSTDTAWRSDSFVPKGFAEGALKARHLKPGLLSEQGERSRCKPKFGSPADSAHTSPKPHRQVSIQNIRHIQMQ